MAAEGKFRIKGDDQGAEDVFESLEAALKGMKKRTDESNAALKKQADQMGISVAELKRLRRGVEEVNQETRDLETTAGDADSILKGLGGSLGLVSDEANKALSGAGELAGGLEAVLRVGSQLGGPAGVIGAVAAATGVAAGAWALLNRELEKGEEKIDDAREALEKMIGVHRAVKEAALLAAVANGDLTEADAQRQMNIQKGADLFDDAINRQTEKLEELRLKLADATNSENAFHSSVEAVNDAVKAVSRLLPEALGGVGEVDELTGQFNAAQTALDNLEAARARHIEDLNDIDEGSRNAKAATREHNEALKEQAIALLELAAVNDALRGNFDSDFAEMFAAREAAFAAEEAQADRFAKTRLARAEREAQEELAARERYYTQAVGLAQSFGQRLTDEAISLQENLLTAAREGGALVLQEMAKIALAQAALLAPVNPAQAAALVAAASAAGVAGGVLQGGGLPRQQRNSHRRRNS